MQNNQGDDFIEYKRLFVHEIEELNKDLKEIKGMLGNLRDDFLILKTRVYIYVTLLGAGITTGINLIFS